MFTLAQNDDGDAIRRPDLCCRCDGRDRPSLTLYTGHMMNTSCVMREREREAGVSLKVSEREKERYFDRDGDRGKKKPLP